MAVSQEFVRQDRSAEFREYAERRYSGSVEVAPLQLMPHERRLHVRQTLLEDHRSRIENRPDGAQRKFDTLAEDPFLFFRGTALLNYRDYAGSDAHLPIVFTIGDAHTPRTSASCPMPTGRPSSGSTTSTRRGPRHSPTT